MLYGRRYGQRGRPIVLQIPPNFIARSPRVCLLSNHLHLLNRSLWENDTLDRDCKLGSTVPFE